MAINSAKHLPEFIIMLLDDDLIEFLCFRKKSQAVLYGSMLEWLVQEVETAISTRKEYLPDKAKNKSPMIYWVQLPNNKCFTDDVYDSQLKFNLTLESIIKQKSNMRILHIKESWDANDKELITATQKISETGLGKYWTGIDAAFRFNMQKRTEFLAREVAKLLHRSRNLSGDDPMYQVFQRRQHEETKHRQDRYHRARDSIGHHEDDRRIQTDRRRGNRFILPRPKFSYR